jgi:hypothetical protein
MAERLRYTRFHFQPIRLVMTTLALSFLLIVIGIELLVLIGGQEPLPVGRQARIV